MVKIEATVKKLSGRPVVPLEEAVSVIRKFLQELTESDVIVDNKLGGSVFECEFHREAVVFATTGLALQAISIGSALIPETIWAENAQALKLWISSRIQHQERQKKTGKQGLDDISFRKCYELQLLAGRLAKRKMKVGH